MQEKIKLLKEKHKEEFKLLYEFNILSYKIIDSYKGKELTKENEYVFPAFVQLNKLYQSSIIMLERGLVTSFEILLRSMIEIAIQIKYVFLDVNNIEKLRKTMVKKALDKLKYIEEKKMYKEFPKTYIDKNIKQLNYIMEKSKKNKIKEAPNLKKMCEDVNCTEVYLYYKFLCNPTHGDFATVECLNIFDEEGMTIKGDEDYSEFKDNCFQVISILDIVLEEMINRYEPNLNEEYIDLKKHIEKIYKINNQKNRTKS